MIEFEASLHIEVGVEGDIAFDVRRAHEDRLEATLREQRVEGGSELGRRSGRSDADEVSSAARLGQLLHLALSGFQPDDFEGMVDSAREFLDGGDGIGRRGVDEVGGAELLRGLELAVDDVDSDDVLRTGQSCPADRIEADASGADDGNRVAGADVRSVDGGSGTRDDRAAEQCGLRERNLIVDDRQLVLVDEDLFGESADVDRLCDLLDRKSVV